MLRINTNISSAGAKRYYSTADYYSEGQELSGVWHGRAAAMLGLQDGSPVTQAAWDALCDNRHPHTGERLTARTKSTRRIGYDFNFHAPKSVSLLYAMTQDERMLDAFRASVDQAMRHIEAEMKTRVRTGGQDADRTTGNLAWGEYIHLTARPVEGEPDPHLHAHCFAFNVTYDAEEERFKAGQFGDLKRDGAYFEAIFHHELAGRLGALGLPIERTRQGCGERWELAGLDRSTLQRFSRRTELIERAAKEHGIADPASKAELGAKTRDRKRHDLSMPELCERWASRLTPDEKQAINSLASQMDAQRGGAGMEPAPSAQHSVTHAIDHAFERRSVVPLRTLAATAIKHSLGRVPLSDIERELHKRDLILAEQDGQTLASTKTVLEEERRVVDFARQGRGTLPTPGQRADEAGRLLDMAEHTFQRSYLNQDQRRAVLHVLSSRDRVTLIRGGAGTGKTSMMKEAIEALDARGVQVFAFAPSAEASRGVLREQEGLPHADTVARLLLDDQLQARARGQVIWIDEAGLVSMRDMAKVVNLADRLDARLVLSGDRRQHAAVERGSPLRLLETEAGLVPAEIRQIQRQRGAYRQTVHALSEGRVEEAMRRLHDLGWIRQCPEATRHATLAQDYVDLTAHGASCLVVSPTRAEGRAITHAIRDNLKAKGQLGTDEREFTILRSRDLTEAERRQPASYSTGDVLVFHQNVPGLRRGQKLVVQDPTEVPFQHADRFQVYRQDSISIAPGDRLRVTRNGRSLDGHRLHNGSLHTVRGLDANGHVVLDTGWRLDARGGHLDHGYVATSVASQGKTVDHVLIGQSSRSGQAASRAQFYVSLSRGRKSARVYTDDARALLDSVSRGDDRLSASELANLRSMQRGRWLARERIQGTVRRVAKRVREWERAARSRWSDAHAREGREWRRDDRDLDRTHARGLG